MKQTDREKKLARKQYKADFKRKMRDYIDVIKENTPCAICKNSFPAVCMDFHHIDSGRKKRSIHSIVHRGSRPQLDAELKKCVLLCANCHRILHFVLSKDVPYQINIGSNASEDLSSGTQVAFQLPLNTGD